MSACVPTMSWALPSAISAFRCRFCVAVKRARHQNYGDPKRRKELLKSPRVLLGEDFSRGHEGRLMAVLDRAEARRRRDHRLAASDVSLHEPVHGTAGREVAQNVIDGRLLRAGEREGEKLIKRLHMARVHGLGAELVPLCADGGEACGKDEKFLKDEPPARFLQSLKRRGKVHRLIGKVRGAKTIAGLHSLRQNVRKSIQARVERLPDARADELVGDAGGEGINGKNPARHRTCRV